MQPDDRGVRRPWRDGRHSLAALPVAVIDPGCESGWRRLVCADVADMSLAEVRAEVRRAHGLLRAVERHGDRLIWHGADGTPISDRQWLIQRIARLRARLDALLPHGAR